MTATYPADVSLARADAQGRGQAATRADDPSPAPLQAGKGGDAGDMLRAVAVAGDGEPFDVLTLDHEARHCRRVRVATDGGRALMIDLAHARHLRNGDRLVLEDGRRVLVRAAPEPVLDIAAADLARIAWHLGNRHCPTQVLDGALRIRADHVLAAMLRGLGCTLVERTAPFEPEHGAYHTHDH
jgi:urease accessory protein